MSTSKLLMTTAVGLLFTAGFASHAAAQETRQPPRQDPPAQTQGADEEEETEVEEIVVNATRPDVVTLADRMSYDVTRDLSAQTGSVADVLRNVPGVEVDVQGNVSLRGDSNVEIYIDGRPSGMFRGQGRADALQAMSGSQIERVEVITNPSAAFSPEGSGGIINLVTRKQRPQTTASGSIRASWDGGERGNVSFSGSRADGPLTLSGDLGYRRHSGENEVETSRVRPGATPATTILEDSTFEGENVFQMVNGRLAADYDLNDRDRISAEINARDMSAESQGLGTFQRATGAGTTTDAYTRASENEFSNSGVSGRATWRRKFSGDQHELVTDLDFDHNSGDRTQFAIQDVTVGGGADFVELIENDDVRDAYGLKVDYTRPMGERRTLKLGYEGDWSFADFDSSGLRGPDESSLAPVAALTNQFEYDQSIHAVYATYDRPFGSLDVQAGLRIEQVDFTLNQITDGIEVDRDYLRAYPTLHMGYQLTETQRLRGSYSRRIQRPSPQDLNPYTVYQDPQNLRRGNPDLEPEITDSFELSWQMRAGPTFLAATAFHRISDGGVTDVAQDLGGGVVLTTRENLAEAERSGVEFIANGRLPGQITYNVSGTVFRNEITTPGFGSRSGTSGSARASINWQPTEDDFFQLNGFWIGEQIQAQGSREPFGQLNLGWRRKITDKFSLIVTGTNILDAAKQEFFVETPQFQDRTTARFGQPVWFIGFTWTLGGGPRRQEPAFDFNTGGGPGG